MEFPTTTIENEFRDSLVSNGGSAVYLGKNDILLPLLVTEHV